MGPPLGPPELMAGALIFAVLAAAKSEGDCPDIHGRIIAPGLHYVPGPDTCTLCICENGQPKWCKAVLCSPPQDCKSLFRQGNTCCEFICLDDALSNHPEGGSDDHQDFGLRLIASAVTVVLFLSILFFMVHRLRQRKLRGHQTRQINDDQRSLASIGYIGGSLGYLGGGCDDAPVHFPSLWKPPGNYFPRGEAPPPYDEAIAQTRAELIGVTGFHRSFPLNATANVESLMRSDSSHSSQTRNRGLISESLFGQFHSGGNIAPRQPPPFYLNNMSTAHLSVGDTIADMRDRQVVVVDNSRARNFTAQHSISSSAGNNNFISTLKITSSLGPIGNRNRVTSNRGQSGFPYGTGASTGGLEPLINNGTSTQPRVMPNSSVDASRHRTIPRMINSMDYHQNDNRSFSNFNKRPAQSKPFRDTAATLPDDILRHSGSNSPRYSVDTNNPRLIVDNPKLSSTMADPDNAPRYTREAAMKFPIEKTPNDQKNNDNVPAAETEKDAGHGEGPSADVAKLSSSSTLGRPIDRHPLLPISSESNTCGCSYDPENLGIMNDDQDDYHSECENCKSANGSRYYLDESEEGSELCETMTLHRRPLQEHSTEDLNQLPTSLTLPVKTKRNRCPTGSRDAWFSSMPGTSSSEED